LSGGQEDIWFYDDMRIVNVMNFELFSVS